MFISSIITRTGLALLGGLVCFCAAQGAAAGEVRFHKIRVVYSSTSDWTALVPATEAEEDKIKSVQLFGRKDNGIPMIVDTQRYWLKINDVKDTLSPGPDKEQITYTDMAVDASVATAGLRFKLSKGSIGDVVVQFWGFDQDGKTLQIGKNHVLLKGAGMPTTLDITLDGPSLTAVAPERTFSYQDFGRKAFAFYYGWYWTPGQWSTAPETDLIDYPYPQTYSSWNGASMVGMINQAANAGLNGLIMSWWGFGNDRSNVDALKQAIELSKLNFHFSIYYETLRSEITNLKDPVEQDRKIVSDLVQLVTLYGKHANYLRIGTRPVIFLFATSIVPPERWKAIFANVRQETKATPLNLDPFFIGSGCLSDMVDVFDGMHDYGVVDKPDLAKHVKRCSTVVKNHFLLKAGPRRLWAGTASPGYDDTKWQKKTTPLKVERNRGEYFKHTLNIATTNQPDWMLITSWNEYPENTHIEPSKLYGDTYQRISNDYLTRWKGPN